MRLTAPKCAGFVASRHCCVINLQNCTAVRTHNTAPCTWLHTAAEMEPPNNAVPDKWPAHMSINSCDIAVTCPGRAQQSLRVRRLQHLPTALSCSLCSTSLAASRPMHYKSAIAVPQRCLLMVVLNTHPEQAEPSPCSIHTHPTTPTQLRLSCKPLAHITDARYTTHTQHNTTISRHDNKRGRGDTARHHHHHRLHPTDHVRRPCSCNKASVQEKSNNTVEHSTWQHACKTLCCTWATAPHTPPAVLSTPPNASRPCKNGTPHNQNGISFQTLQLEDAAFACISPAAATTRFLGTAALVQHSSVDTHTHTSQRRLHSKLHLCSH